MRYIEKADCLLIARECTELFEKMGFTHILVYACCGDVEISILGGRTRRLTKAERARFNEQKCWGMCYHVTRDIFIFGKHITLWSNKHWDTD